MTGRTYPPDLAKSIKNEISIDRDLENIKNDILKNSNNQKQNFEKLIEENDKIKKEITDLIRANEEVMNPGPKDAIYDQLQLVRKLNEKINQVASVNGNKITDLPFNQTGYFGTLYDSLINEELNRQNISKNNYKNISQKKKQSVIDNVKYALMRRFKDYTESLSPIAFEMEPVYQDLNSLILKVRIAKGNYELNTIDIIELSNSQYFITGSEMINEEELSSLDSAMDKYYASVFSRILQINTYKDTKIQSKWHVRFYCSGYTDTQGFNQQGVDKYTDYCIKNNIEIPNDPLLRRMKFNEILSYHRAININNYALARFHRQVNTNADTLLRNEVSVSNDPKNINGFGEVYPDPSRINYYITKEKISNGDDISRRKTYFQGIFNMEVIRE